MLDEYALRFYALLEQSIRLDASDWIESVYASAITAMSDDTRKELMDSYDNARRDIIEVIRDAQNNEDGVSQMREQFK